MMVTTHQPIFLPWPGFFFKALKADCLILLDNVQFPRGGTWLTRNRLKGDNGELWLRLPVCRKGLGLRNIREVELFYQENWPRKHLLSLEQKYANAPYLGDHFDGLKRIYEAHPERLASFNLELIRFLCSALGMGSRLLLQSELKVTGKGTELICSLCRKMKATRFLSFPMVRKYLDLELMKEAGIEVEWASYQPPVYPQLWGDFIQNLSTLDLLLNCGPKSLQILSGTTKPT